MVRIEAESSTGPSAPRLDGSILRRLPPLRSIPGRNWTKADVVVRSVDGILMATKDYGGRSFLVRNTLGRWLIGREVRALTAARGVPGLVVLVGRIGPYALATRWIDGAEPISRRGGSLAPELFERVSGLLDALHSRGVALGDFHHRDLLVSEDGAPHVTDLATALVLGDRPGRLRRALFDRWRDQDRVALARMRARYTGGDPAAAVAALGGKAAAWHARGRGLKRFWDRLRRRR